MSELQFTATHEWAKKESENVTVGITEHAQQLLGDVIFVELPEIGSTCQAGQVFGTIESVKAASDLYAPLSGTITAINAELQQNPALVNTHPFSTGWLVKIKPSRLEEMEALLTKDEYQQTIHETF
jgi:glycine cleavage system H protein